MIADLKAAAEVARDLSINSMAVTLGVATDGISITAKATNQAGNHAEGFHAVTWPVIEDGLLVAALKAYVT